MPLRLKIILLVILPICGLFFLLKLYDYYHYERLSEREIKQKLLEQSQKHSKSVDAILRQASSTATSMADFLSVTGGVVSEDELYEALELNLLRNDLVYGSAAAFVPGYFEGRRRFSPYVYRSGSALQRIDIGASAYDYTEPQWEWFAKPVATGKFVWSRPYFDEGAGNILMVTFSAPVRGRGDEVMGVVTVDLDVTKLPELAAIESTEGEHFMLVDQSGIIIYDSISENIGLDFLEVEYFSNMRSSDLKSLLGAPVPRLADIDSVDQGVSWLAVSKVPSSDWFFLVSMREENALAILFSQQLRVIGVVLFILMVFVFVSWLLTGNIIRPIRKIALAAEDIASGDYGASLPPPTKDEIGSLSVAFATMRDRVLEREQDLREINETLEQRIEERTRRLSESDRNLQLTLDNMPGALIVTAPDLSIRVLTSNFNEYVNLPKDFIRAGDSHEKILRYMAMNGYYGEDVDVEKVVQERILSILNPTSEILYDHMPDGRVNAVTRRRSKEGDVITVVVDVTEQKQRETELDAAKSKLAERNSVLENLSGQLAKYLSPQIYDAIFTGKSGTDITTQRKKLTVFFSDIKDFTSTTEELEPEDMTFLLNDYLTKMTDIALEHGGTIDKYNGDAIMVFFGDPDTRGVKEDAVAAVNMAIAMQRRMVDLRAKWTDMGYRTPFHIRCGINTGYCNVGNFGSEQRIDYTIIGGQVNLAARLESICEPDGITIAYETYTLVRDTVDAEQIESIQVKGIRDPVQPYKILGVMENWDASERYIRSNDVTGMRLWVDVTRISPKQRDASIKRLESAIERLKNLDIEADEGSA